MWGGPCTGHAWSVHAPDVHGGAHTGCMGDACTRHAWGVNTLGVCGGSMHWACVGVHTPGMYGGSITRHGWESTHEVMSVIG